MDDIPPVNCENLKVAFEALHDHLGGEANIDPASVLDDIADRVPGAGSAAVVALFVRAAALQNMIEEDAIRETLQALSDGDEIPDIVFNAASTLPVEQASDTGGASSSSFDPAAFLSAVRGTAH